MSGLELFSLPSLFMGLSAAGTIVNTVGAIVQGQAQKDAADFQAAQAEQQAQESRAASQRQSMESRRKGMEALSTLQARAAASGGGADDPTVQKLGENIAGRSEYQALTDEYTGENRARGYQDRATAARMSGDAAVTGSYFKAAGTLLDGASGMFDKYKRYQGGYQPLGGGYG